EILQVLVGAGILLLVVLTRHYLAAGRQKPTAGRDEPEPRQALGTRGCRPAPHSRSQRPPGDSEDPRRQLERHDAVHERRALYDSRHEYRRGPEWRVVRPSAGGHLQRNRAERATER